MAVPGTRLMLLLLLAVRMDPFCVLQLGNSKAKTHTAWGALLAYKQCSRHAKAHRTIMHGNSHLA